MKKTSKKIYCMPDFNAVEIAPAAVIASSGGVENEVSISDFGEELI